MIANSVSAFRGAPELLIALYLLGGPPDTLSGNPNSEISRRSLREDGVARVINSIAATQGERRCVNRRALRKPDELFFRRARRA